MTINEAILAVWEETDSEQSVHTQRTYRVHGRAALAYWGSDTELDSLTRLQVQAWANERKKSAAPATVRHELAFLRRCFRAALDRGLIQVSPISKIRIPPSNNRRERVLTEEEESLLREKLGPQRFSLVQFAIQTGIRRLEQFSLRPNEVQLWKHDDGELVGLAHIRTSKTGLGRRVPLNPVASKIAKDWMKLAHPWLFGEPRDDRYELGQHYSFLLRQATRALGIEDFRWHDLRHTCASRALQNGARIEQVQALLGHKSVTQTQRYCHWTDDHVWPAAMAVCANRTSAFSVPPPSRRRKGAVGSSGTSVR